MKKKAIKTPPRTKKVPKAKKLAPKGPKLIGDAMPDPKLVAPTPTIPQMTPQQESANRARACEEEIQCILTKYNCQIVPFLDHPKAIGPEPTREVIMSANCAIRPL